MAGAEIFEASFEEAPTYLHAKLTGTRSPQNIMRFLEQVHRECVKRERTAVLLDMHLEGPSLDMGEIFRVISQRAPAGATLRKIAYVEETPNNPARAKFAETVAMNRGVNVRLFDDPEAAKKWLSVAAR